MRNRRWKVHGHWSVVAAGLLVSSLGGCGGCGLTTPGTEESEDSGQAQTNQDGGTNNVGDGGAGSSSSRAGSSGVMTSSGGGTSAAMTSSGGGSSNASGGTSNASGGTSNASGGSGTLSSSDPGSSSGSASGGSSVAGSGGASSVGGSGGASSVGGSGGASSVGGSGGASSVGGSGGASSLGGSGGVTSAGGSSVGGTSTASSAGGVTSGPVGSSSAGAGSSSGSLCPLPVLGGATEDIYVDKGVAATGNGTLACPFKTILEASSLPAPGNATTLRTIHVRGYAGGTVAATYAETSPILLEAKVKLTSNYDAGNPGGAALVRIVSAGSCVSVTGAAANCAVGLNNDATLELVTVSTRAGALQTHAIVTTNVAVPPGGNPPRILDVNAENATANGIRVASSATLGPRVNATGNAQNGVLVQIGALGPSSVRPAFILLDAAVAAASTNNFSNNGGNGAAIFGDVSIQVDGLTADTNANNGLAIATPLLPNVAGQPTHQLANLALTNNTNHGLRLNSGDVFIHAGRITNAFNLNGGYGIDTSLGDSLGGARVVTEAAIGLGGAYLIAHQANGNRQGGIHIHQSTPAGYGSHVLESVEALRNGLSSGSGGGALASGLFVEVTGANQPSVRVRGSSFLGNTSVGVRFQRNTNTLDVGTFSGIVFDPGQNIFASNMAQNVKGALCVENLAANNLVQEVETNRWATQPCPFPLLPPPPPTFIQQLGNGGTCGSNTNYVDITYTTAPATTVAFTANTCF